MSTPLAQTPPPPYYAVIFTSRQTTTLEGYEAASRRMVELASARPGFLGLESARGADGLGITVSYWRDLEAIRSWKADAEHRTAQAAGQSSWYEAYSVRIACVERAYDFRSDAV